jgi:hypothetical protein
LSDENAICLLQNGFSTHLKYVVEGGHHEQSKYGAKVAVLNILCQGECALSSLCSRLVRLRSGILEIEQNALVKSHIEDCVVYLCSALNIANTDIFLDR